MTPTDLDDELAFLETATPADQDTDANLLRHQLVTSPLLTYSTLKHRVADFPSRGLLGTYAGDRVYVNTNAPSSVVICGVQGSGKSHTVSCLLECALIPDRRIGLLPEPLSALVFHFDTQDCGRPCEAAFLSSPTAHHAALPQVTVLCSPSNVTRRRRAYASLAQVRVEPLSLSEKDLTADRMLAIMGCDNLETMPLYMHIALLIIRNMGVDEFSYQEFKRRIGLERLDAKQEAMIKLRLDLLDAFIRPGAPEIESYFTAGGLVLVDLTDPFLDSLTAAVLFDIVLGTFTQWQTVCGKLVVLDEAHQYLTNSAAARLTHSVNNIIRLQRHLATRVIIATQEPTVIPPTILDLASIIICHQFSSPAWCAHLARHVSAGNESGSSSWSQQVMLLPAGDALVFSPAAVIRADEQGGVVLLGRDHLRLQVRPRLTLDGGTSLLAVGRSLPARAGASAALPLSLPTPPTSGSSLPAEQDGTAPPMATPISTASMSSATLSSPLSAAATPSHSHAHEEPALPTSAAFSFRDNLPSPDWFSTAATLQDVDFVTPVTRYRSPPADGPGPSAPSVVQATGAAQRAVPGRLKHLMSWLSRSGGADAPLKLGDAQAALSWVGKKHYANMPGKSWWPHMLQEAVKEGLVELINITVRKTELKARGEEKMIRLLEHGPFLYV
ncbi:hypothetical protein DFH07DRAFT_969608 [Mycena maculata]|uniref:AAA+ ATPase domain-containing protein n=1 Tax=Mycena maculata TaxID=230809 RepID=A0AAD7MRR9_9AGAR|nr:hypothetical protein DFH07DRAFT_969608 [Mycena maculata]